MDLGLISRVHGLPPELFNQIQYHVLLSDLPRVELGNCIKITNDWRYPIGLHISQQTRNATIKHIFVSATLIIPDKATLLRFYPTLDALMLSLLHRLVIRVTKWDDRLDDELIEGFLDHTDECGVFYEKYTTKPGWDDYYDEWRGSERDRVPVWVLEKAQSL